MASYNIDIDIDKKCAECRKGGATGSGVCLGCAAKVLGSGRLKSPEARALRVRMRSQAKMSPFALAAAATSRPK